MTIAYIIWPNDGKAARLHYMGFIVPVAESIGLRFSSHRPDPIARAKGYVEGLLSEQDLEQDKVRWWGEFDAAEPHSHKAATCRMAICLLSTGPNDPQNLGDQLSWFFEVLHMLEVDTAGPIEQFHKYFSFRAPRNGKS